MRNMFALICFVPGVLRALTSLHSGAVDVFTTIDYYIFTLAVCVLRCGCLCAWSLLRLRFNHRGQRLFAEKKNND